MFNFQAQEIEKGHVSESFKNVIFIPKVGYLDNWEESFSHHRLEM